VLSDAHKRHTYDQYGEEGLKDTPSHQAFGSSSSSNNNNNAGFNPRSAEDIFTEFFGRSPFEYCGRSKRRYSSSSSSDGGGLISIRTLLLVENMKYLEYTCLDSINDFLGRLNLGERTIKGCLEAYSCKHAGTDKKLSMSLENEILDHLGKSCDSSSSSPVDYLISKSSRKTLIYLVLTLYHMYPDYDYSVVNAHQFFTEESWASFEQIFDTYMFEASKVWIEAKGGNSLLDDLYRALDEVIDLPECEMYSYNPDCDADPFLEKGATWSFNFFFYNRKLKRIAIKIMNDEMQCDIIKVGNLVRNKVEEIYNFTQDDLLTEDTLILDTHAEVFVWVGHTVDPKEKQKAFEVGEKYIALAASLEGLPQQVPLYKITEGNELHIMPETDIVTIEIKPGWKKGTKITFPDKGGNNNNNNEQLPVDLIFIVDEKKHDVYKRDANDLTTNVTLAEAIGGTTLNLTTLDGRTLTLPVTDIITPNYQLLIANEGMPITKEPRNKGRLRVNLSLRAPCSQRCPVGYQASITLLGTSFHYGLLDSSSFPLGR
ncbi:LOW QUALITY PROTEIN: hypothetical protein V2J09_022549, partial [Rumex salicifolius]